MAPYILCTRLTSSPSKHTLEHLLTLYHSLRIVLKKEYIYLLFEDKEEAEMFKEEKNKEEHQELSGEVFEILGNQEEHLAQIELSALQIPSKETLEQLQFPLKLEDSVKL